MHTPNNAILKIKNVSKTYKNGFTALRNVSFDVYQGDFFALLGNNGAGKTTLISSIAGLTSPSSGDIYVLNNEIKKKHFEIKKLLGVVPQELLYDPFFTVKETLTFQSGYFGIRNNEKWINQILEKLGLSDKKNENTRNLSGGMKRRLMVAQALVHKPPIIILDEPTAGVDIGLRQSLWQFMKELNDSGHTIILTTHYLEEAESLCNRIAIMKKGELISLDTKDNLLKNKDGIKITVEFNGHPSIIFTNFIYQKVGDFYTFKLDHYEEITSLIEDIKNHQLSIKKLHFIEKNLEDIFLSLMMDQS